MDGVEIVMAVLSGVMIYLSILLWNFKNSAPKDYPQCKQCGKTEWTETEDGKYVFKCENCGHPERFKPENAE